MLQLFKYLEGYRVTLCAVTPALGWDANEHSANEFLSQAHSRLVPSSPKLIIGGGGVPSALRPSPKPFPVRPVLSQSLRNFSGKKRFCWECTRNALGRRLMCDCQLPSIRARATLYSRSCSLQSTPLMCIRAAGRMAANGTAAPPASSNRMLPISTLSKPTSQKLFTWAALAYKTDDTPSRKWVVQTESDVLLANSAPHNA